MVRCALHARGAIYPILLLFLSLLASSTSATTSSHTQQSSSAHAAFARAHAAHTTSIVADRFIVGFHSYRDAADHEHTLRAMWAEWSPETRHVWRPLRQSAEECHARWNTTTQCSARAPPSIEWTVVTRDNPSASLPTDFLLLHVARSDAATRGHILGVLQKLVHEHDDVLKYVLQERQVTQALMSINEEEEEEEQEEEGYTWTVDGMADLQLGDDHHDAIQRHATTADTDSPSIDSSSDLPSRPPVAGGVGDFPPPRRFDLGRSAVADPHRNVTPAASLAASLSSPVIRKLCQWSGSVGNSPTELLNARRVWDAGYRGGGIRIAIFDTGLSKTHPHFGTVDERTNWTDEHTLEDGLGHGTFVAGVIAAARDCLGFAPEARLHIFRVFNQRQLSFTSWFLDAFNYAIHSRVHVLNLSIGGPDFLDRPFVEKVNELSANGVSVVSAIGNDGPLWGTLNNPADQMDVIGVGGINDDLTVSSFSSRGMTTGELPSGYGRMKPDLVALARNIRGSNQGSGCKTMSGTSVASPVVAGCVTLLASVVPPDQRAEKLNPAFLKQLLLESAVRLPQGGPRGPGIFEQGEGAISLENAFGMLTDPTTPFEPHASIVPSKLDLTDCPYMWPYCTQPIYFTAAAIMLNLTLLNSQSVASFVPTDSPPRFHPADAETRQFLRVRFTHAESFWPWSGWFAVHLTLEADVPETMLLSGFIELTVETEDESRRRSVVKLPLRVEAIPQPPRDRRLLFDLFHNLRYPSGYFPRDNLEVKSDTLDWNGDHIHTNYRELYTSLRDAGYFIEVLGRDFTCFDASRYTALIIVDPEEEYFVEEVAKLQDDVYLEGLSLMVLADWYNTRVMREIRFYDENTAEWWTPETGGANIPALNSLLAGFGVQLTDDVLKGDITIGGETFYFASGASIGRFPAGGTMSAHRLTDAGSGSPTREYNIMGVYEPAGAASPLASLYPNAGRLFVYGDSNCVDMNHRRGHLCAPLILSALHFLRTGDKSGLFSSSAAPLTSAFVDSTTTSRPPPRRAVGNNLIKYSKVTSAGSAPQCPVIGPAPPADALLAAASQYEQQHLALRSDSTQSADESKASSRFNAIKRIKQKRRQAPFADDVDDDLDEVSLSPSSTPPTDQNKPPPVLTKQARLHRPDTDGDSEEVEPAETEKLFAASPVASAMQHATDARKAASSFWLRLILLAVVASIAAVAIILRRQTHDAHHKRSPNTAHARHATMEPKSLSL